MTQLDEFREQLRQRPKLNENKGEKVRKKKNEKEAHATLWVTKEVQRKAKLLILWLEAEGVEGPGSIGGVVAEAIDVLIDTKYPQAKEFLDR